MKRTPKLLTIHLITLFVFILTTVTMRTIATLTDFNFETGYFKDKILINISNWITVFASVIGLTYIALDRSKVQYKASFDTALSYVPAGVVSVALVFFSATEIFRIVRLPSAFFSVQTFGDAKNLFSFIVALFALVSIGYFIAVGVIEHSNSSERAAFGIVTCVFFALYAAYLQMFPITAMNSPTNTTELLTYAMAGVFFLYETRISLGRGQWAMYTSFGFVAALLTAYSSIPALIVYFAEKKIIASSLASIVLMLTLCIFICSRLALVLKLYEDTKCDTANAITLMASARVKEIEELRLAHARDIIIEEENESDDAETSLEEDTNYTIDIDSIDPEKTKTEGEE